MGCTEGAAHGNVLSYPAQQLLGTHDRPFSLPAPGGLPQAQDWATSQEAAGPRAPAARPAAAGFGHRTRPADAHPPRAANLTKPGRCRLTQRSPREDPLLEH